jgi:hypothetical protein
MKPQIRSKERRTRRTTKAGGRRSLPIKPVRLPPLLTVGALLDQTSARNFVVEEVVPSRSTVAFVGQPGTFKSTAAVGVAGSVAYGIPWHGRGVQSGAVLIIAGEGYGGLADRIRAWAKYNGVKVKAAPIIVCKGGVPLLNRKRVQALADETAKRLKTLGKKLRLIIVDPIARSFGTGDENKSTDMSRFMENVDWLRDRFDCSTILVHHSGHNDRGRARGSSAFKAALDLEVVFRRKGLGLQLKCSKSKDAPEFEDIELELEEVPLRLIRSRKPRASVVLVHASRTLRGGNLPAKQIAALDVLRDLVKLKGRKFRDSAGNVRVGVSLDRWRKVSVEQRKIVATSDGFDKLKRKLVKYKEIIIRNGHASLKA